MDRKKKQKSKIKMQNDSVKFKKIWGFFGHRGRRGHRDIIFNNRFLFWLHRGGGRTPPRAGCMGVGVAPRAK